MRFHHVGYATANIDRFVEDFFRPVFAPLAISDKISDPIQRVTVCFARLQGDTLMELVEPLGENSPVDSVIGSSRGGVYHLCYEVEDLNLELALPADAVHALRQTRSGCRIWWTSYRVHADPSTRSYRTPREGLKIDLNQCSLPP
jgi:catechol 2,3-dioxygenase-like lactoylglutathione lyase family enzyme